MVPIGADVLTVARSSILVVLAMLGCPPFASWLVMWRLPSGFLLLFGFPVPPLCCYLSLPPGALLCGKILASDFAGNYGSLDACRLVVRHILGNDLVHTGPCDSCPCVFHLDHSHHVVG